MADITVIHIDQWMDCKDYRNFTVIINDVKITGKAQLLGKIHKADKKTRHEMTYRFYWPKELRITDHPDYKNIRIQLIYALSRKSKGMNALNDKLGFPHP